MSLSVELERGSNPEVAISFDRGGIELLIKKLEYLRSHIGHLHLMTPSWGGHELAENVRGGESYILINSLRLVRLPD